MTVVQHRIEIGTVVQRWDVTIARTSVVAPSNQASNVQHANGLDTKLQTATCSRSPCLLTAHQAGHERIGTRRHRDKMDWTLEGETRYARKDTAASDAHLL